MGTFLHSPMNYTGGKHKLLPQIIPLFPENINTFVDLFCGGCNVGINVNCNNIIYNDSFKPIIEIYQYFKTHTIEETLETIEKRITEYSLTKTNKEGFDNFRDFYNQNPSPIDLFILVAYSFNHQIRFNKKGEFNMPFGKERSEFNQNMRKNLIEFVKRLHNTKNVFTNFDFKLLKPEKLSKNDFVYCDPPYLITCATYNEQDGWNETHERELLSLLDRLNEKGIRFGLSNCLSNKGKENTILKEWTEKNNYNIHHLNYSYSNCNYHTDKTQNTTDEVLITNY